MRITCPHCEFSREVPDDKVPARSVRATCPKCKHKFQFRRIGNEAVSSLDEQTQDMTGAVSSPTPVAPIRQEPEMPAYEQRASEPPRSLRSTLPQDDVPPTYDQDPDQVAYQDPDQVAYQDPPQEHYSEESPIESVRYTEPQEGDTEQDNESNAHVAYDDTPTDTNEPSSSRTPGQMRADNPDDIPFQHRHHLSKSSDREGQDIWSKLEAMEQDTRRRADNEVEPVDDAIPWEHLDRHGFLNGFASTIFKIMFKPLSFFGNMARDERETPKIGKALVFNILISELIVLMDFVWLFVGARTKLAGGEEARELLHVLSDSPGLELLVFMLLIPFMFAIAAYIDAGLIHLLLMVFRGAKRSFAHTFRAICYSGAPLIILAIPVAGQVLSPMVMVWSMSLQAIGLQRVHGIASTQALAAVLIKWTLYVLLFMQLGNVTMP